MNRKIFYDTIRPLFGKLKSSQVDGLNILLDGWAKRYAGQDIRHLAYCLATTYHETATTMRPIEEYGSDARANKLYGIEGKNPTRARKMGNTRVGDGARYKGRGYVQLTWKCNYERASKVLGDDLVKHPERAMRPDYAAQILYQGCMEGWFTGHRLADHLTSVKTDYTNARRIVNGTDKATKIADYAVQFEEALRAAYEGENDPHTPPASPPEPEEMKPKKSFIDVVLDVIEQLFKR